MRFVVFFGVYLATFMSFGQEKGDLSFRFAGGYQQMNMTNINSFILDQSKHSIGALGTPRSDKFEHGLKITGSLGYQLSDFWSIELWMSHQNSDCFHDDGYPIMNEGILDTLNNRVGYFMNNNAVGVKSRYNLRGLLNSGEKSNWKNRLLLGLNFGVAYSRSNFRASQYFFSLEDDMKLTNETRLYEAQSNGVLFDCSLDIGFTLSRNNLISAFGIEGGYQFLLNSNLNNRGGDSFLNQYEAQKVELAGLFFGAFFIIGK